jgi:ATP-dependent Clp protease adaptor protein ClpS
METTAPPKEREEREHQVDGEKLAELIPRYHVVLLDDEDHTYEYVVEMLMQLFRHGREMSWKMASEVDQRGLAIVFTTNKEQAEHKRSQIQSGGADKRLVRSKGSMSAIVEKAD